MAIISRGFSGRRSAGEAKLPPGQYLTTDFPVLSAGPTPHISLDRWEFTIDDGSNVLKRWDWKSFRELPTENITVDIHCVTRWSKLGTSWEGVSLDVLLADVKRDLPYAMFRSYGDYTTNLPLKDVMNKKAWIVSKFDGADLAPEHGGPARLLVPHLYLWKSAKWVKGMTLMPHDKPGFGRTSVITSMVIHGRKNGTRTSDVAYCKGRWTPRRDTDGPDARTCSSRLARSRRGSAR